MAMITTWHRLNVYSSVLRHDGNYKLHKFIHLPNER